MNIWDAYLILEIDKKANAKEIKQAYRRLALKYHPDKNNSSDASSKFISISEAYELLKTSANTTSKASKSYSPPKFRNENHRQHGLNTYDYESENRRSQRAQEQFEKEFAKQSDDLYINLFAKYKKSKHRQIAILYAFIGIIISGIFVYDLISKAELIAVDINSSKRKSELFIHQNIIGAVVARYKNSDFDINANDLYTIQKHNYRNNRQLKAYIERTPIFKNTIALKISNSGNSHSFRYKTKNLNIFFWTIPILVLMLFPLFSFIIEKPSFNFVFFAINYNIYGFPIALTFIMLYATPLSAIL